jgi:hypothetical protein
LTRTNRAPKAALLGGACLLFMQGAFAGSAPVLYSNPAFQSPVRGHPDELLLLPGASLKASDIVVYHALDDPNASLAPPEPVPDANDATSGRARVVSTHNAPNALTILLPAQMQRGRTYALWVRSASGKWSNGIRINDVRPLWISPSIAYEQAQVASLPRVLKVIGRNLDSAPGQVTRVRLTGSETFTLDVVAGEPGSTLDHYVAVAALPPVLPSGSYYVLVSRDGASWAQLPGQVLTVLPDPPEDVEIAVDAPEFGGCRPNDSADDTVCITAAIEAARAAGGGAVVFGAGEWNLVSGQHASVARGDGIIVPGGVSLRGVGASQTTISREASWTSGSTNSTFTLQGRNRVEGFTFTDRRRYGPADAPVAMLVLGKAYYRADVRDLRDPKRVSDVVITANRFDKPHRAISSGGLPIKRLFVTFNDLGAYSIGFSPSGDRNNLLYPFRIDDSVVAYNTFHPGSYLDVGIGQGAMATAIGAANRLDFSDNVADGTSTSALYDADADAHGWRAAFFWHMNSSHEMMLVSRNRATCAGDKAGDGEAIAYDNNANTFGFAQAPVVRSATADTVTVQASLIGRQNGHNVNVGEYYVGHWVRIVEGQGIAQSRKIVSYAIDPQSSEVTFRVAPEWDVLPATGSGRITVQREFWQVYTVDNVIDQRAPLCQKSNRNAPEGGKIAVWAPTLDSAVEGNVQYDTDGITLHQHYTAEDDACPTCVAGHTLQAFVEVRGNVIEGEYDWDSDCSRSGIQLTYGASPTPASPPPPVGFGVSIVGNTVVHADGLRGGAISLPLAWHEGPAGNWRLVDNTLIQHNLIRDLEGSVPRRSCDEAQTARTGIQLFKPGVSASVLYGNSCVNVARPVADTGANTVRVCPSPALDSCECR